MQYKSKSQPVKAAMPSMERAPLPKAPDIKPAYREDNRPKLKPVNIRVVATEWTGGIEAALAQDIITLNGQPGTQVVLVFDPETPITSAFKNVAKALGAAVELHTVEEEGYTDIPTLVYYTRKRERPGVLCTPENTRYRYVGNESKADPRFTYNPDPYQFPDRSRPLPAKYNLNNMPAPQQLNYQTKLPMWLSQAPTYG